jgi:hypothetical protein
MVQIETGSKPGTVTLPLTSYTLDSGHVCSIQGTSWVVSYPDKLVQECAHQMRSVPRVYGRYTSLTEALDIHRFLVGSKYDTVVALRRYRRFVTFLDNFYHRLAPRSVISQEKSNQLAQYDTHICNTLVGRDGDGRPIMVSQPGKIHVKAFLAMYHNHQLLQERHTWFQEKLRRLCATYPGRPTYQIRVILDLQNVRLEHLKLIPLLRRMTQIDAEFFPETMYDITVVNLPSFFSTVIRLVSTSMDRDTLQKVHVLTGSRWHSQLRTTFPNVAVELLQKLGPPTK